MSENAQSRQPIVVDLCASPGLVKSVARGFDSAALKISEVEGPSTGYVHFCAFAQRICILSSTNPDS